VTTAGPFWPPTTRKGPLFQNNFPLFSYPYYALPPAIQSHLPNASSLNMCNGYTSPVENFYKFRVVKVKKIIPMPRPFTSFTIPTKIKLM